jgi:hypothetical protein
MLRNILLASTAAVALLVPLAPAAQAHEHDFRYEHRHEYRDEYRHEREYHVFYRPTCEAPWCFGGETYGRERAERLAESYRCHGYEVSIR